MVRTCEIELGIKPPCNLFVVGELWFLPIIVSISKSPKRLFSSTTDGLSDMSTRSWMIPLELYRLSRFKALHFGIESSTNFIG